MIALAASLGAACTEEPAPEPDPIDASFVAPTTARELEAVYNSLGTCNGSHLLRTLTPQPARLEETIWSASPAAPADLRRWRAGDGHWTSTVLTSELTSGRYESDVNADVKCQAVARLWQLTVGTRRQFLHALFYLDEGEHPYAAFPAAGVEPLPAKANISLQGYLSVIVASHTPDFIYTVETAQHLPMYLS